MRTEKYITRAMVKAEPNTLFVFGDNMAGCGLGGQAKEMRGEPNAVGIPTKLTPGMNEADFFRDADFERAKPKIDAAFVRLFIHAATGGEIVWPAAGIGTGLAELPRRAPYISQLIENRLIALRAVSNYASCAPINAQLLAVLRPFAEFADPSGNCPQTTVITSGSSIAKRQLTMGDCYAAARVYAKALGF